MDKIKQITGFKIALCSGSETKSSREIVSKLSHRPDIGFLHSFSLPDYIEVIQSGEFHQMKLSSVSAGSDSGLSTLRPDVYIGCGSGLKAGYAVGQKGSTSGECWVK